MKPAAGLPAQRVTPGFYLYSSSSASSTLSSSNVFYWVASEQVAKTLCRLFSKEYSSEVGDPVFVSKSAGEVEQDEQVFIEEALEWLAVYGADPDPGVYDPPPPKGMMVRAEYARRARHWESIIVERTDGEGHNPIEEGTNQIPHLGRKPRLTEDFVICAGTLWRTTIRDGNTNVSHQQLCEIARALDVAGHLEPARYLEGKYAEQVKNFNSRHSNSRIGPLRTWSQLVSNGDKDHLQGMRRLLSRCAAKASDDHPASGINSGQKTSS